MNNISKRLKFLRKKSRLNQEELAAKTGLKRSTIAMIEANDKASSDSVITLSNYFGVEQNWLQNGIGSPPEGYIELEDSTNPWRDAAFKKMEDEVIFYREQVRELTAIIKGMRPTGNFLKVSKRAGGKTKMRELYPRFETLALAK